MSTDAQTQLNNVVAIMREAATSEVMPRFRSSEFSTRTKSHAQDFATEADEAAEQLIVARLTKLYPHAFFLAEESARLDSQSRAALAEAELAFVVDPLDGTANFVAGLPLFAMIVAILERGSPIAGAILDPVRDDVMFAIAGRGSWQQSSVGMARQIKVNQEPRLESARGVGFGLALHASDRTRLFSKLGSSAAATIIQCSGHEYRLLASGRCDYILNAAMPLKPWDHAAGLLLCREAGAFAATFGREQWSGVDEADSILCAASALLWEEIYTKFELGSVNGQS